MEVASIIGIISFVGANLFALAQNIDRRLLGYSSVAQIGLILFVVGQQDILGDSYLFIAGGVLLAHAVGKAGLFWLSGLIAGRELTAWSALQGKPFLIFAFASFLALLIGLPPFPGFYAKWELVHMLAAKGRLLLLSLLLFGAPDRGGLPVPLVRLHDQARQGPPAVDAVPLQARRDRMRGCGRGWALAYLWGELSPHG